MDGAGAAVAVVGGEVGAFVGGGGGEAYLFVAAGGLEFVVAAHLGDLGMWTLDLDELVSIELTRVAFVFSWS